MSNYKIYVDVTVEFSKDGIMVPKSFVWEDGVTYEISKIKDVRRAASLKAGGVEERFSCVVEERFTCEVDGKEVYLIRAH